MMLAHDGIDGALPIWLSADQKPQCLRYGQSLCGEPCIPHIQTLALISAYQIGMRDRKIEVVHQRLERQQLYLCS
jgi:hypothetical protein